MLDYQAAVIKMMQEVESFLDKNSKLYKDKPVIKSHVVKYKQYLAELLEETVKQSINIKGVFQNKRNAKDKLSNLLFVLTAALRSYASDIKSEGLYNEIDEPESILKRKQDLKLIAYADIAIELLEKYKKELKDYNISKDEIELLKSKTAEYSNLLLLPALRRKEKALATSNVKKYITKILNYLRQTIDNDMLTLSLENKDLHQLYLAMREIDDSRTIHLSLLGKIKDKNTKAELEHVKVEIIAEDGSQIKDNIKLTTAKGNYRYKKLKPGTYTIKFSLHGYQAIEKEIEIYKGQTKRVNVEMEKIEN